MQIVFKNTKDAKNCQIFISLFKKLRFYFGSRQKKVYFLVDKTQFRMTTQIQQNLQSPHLDHQNQFIDYKFGKSCYHLKEFVGNDPMVFSLDIDPITKGITHYQETKMVTLSLTVSAEYDEAIISYQTPDEELVGELILDVQKEERKFPIFDEIKKAHIRPVMLFEIQPSLAQKINVAGNGIWYEMTMDGLYLRKYNNLQLNTFEYLISKQLLLNYNIQNIKEELELKMHISEKNNRMLQEIHRCAKKKYSKCQISIILVKSIQQNFTKYEYLQVKSCMTNFGDTIKYVTSKCAIASQSKPLQNVVADKPLIEQSNKLLKAEDQGLEYYRRIVLNRFEPEAMFRNYPGERPEINKLTINIPGDNQETHTRKIIFKIED